MKTLYQSRCLEAVPSLLISPFQELKRLTIFLRQRANANDTKND